MKVRKIFFTVFSLIYWGGCATFWVIGVKHNVSGAIFIFPILGVMIYVVYAWILWLVLHKESR